MTLRESEKGLLVLDRIPSPDQRHEGQQDKIGELISAMALMKGESRD